MMRALKLLTIAIAAQAVSAQAATIVSEDYQSGATTAWSNGAIGDPGANSGGFTRFAGQFGTTEEVSRTFALSGTQTSVNVNFDFYRLDSWDNETFRVRFFDGATEIALDTLLRSYQHGSSTNTVFYGWDDAIDPYAVTLAYSGTALRMVMNSYLDSGMADESWGIDNLVITDNSVESEVPEPAMLGLFGLGAIGLGLARRRKA